MAQTLIRFVAGVGAAVAVTAAGGLDVAVAAADPGSPRTPVSNFSDGASSQSEAGERRVPGHGRHRPDDASGRPATSDSGCVDGQPDTGTGGRPSPSGSPEVSTPSRPTVPGSNAGPPPDEAGPAPAASAAPATFVAPRKSSGRSAAVQAVTARVVPRVTVGDGRTPRHLATERAEPLPIPAAVDETAPVVAAPPIVAAPAALPSLWMESVSPRLPGQVWVPQSPVTSLRGDAQPDWPAGVIVGIAGLFLAPVGGVLLGRRQAKASRSASALITR